MKLSLYLILGTLSLHSLPAQEEPTADELLSYATSLSIRGDVVGIGKEGLRLEGEQLSGISARRPSDAIARAAELTMEKAGKDSDMHFVEDALKLWTQLDSPNTAIPYLRMYSKGTSPFAIYCRARLAERYEELGDTLSAASLFQKLAELPPSDDINTYAIACAARFYLSQNNRTKASELATLVMSSTDRNKFAPKEGGGGFEIARSVLKAIPGSKIPENASQGMARSDFIAQAQTALAAKDYETAIRAYLDHRRTYPNEATARQALLYAAALHVKLQQPQKAIALYDEAEIQYGTFSEGWKAALASAAILESQGNAKGAADKLKASLQKARTPEASAWYIASLAELAAKNKLPDEAAAYYAELLSKYPSQDAAKDALKSLRTSASQIKDWKKLARRLQDELSGTTLQLNKQELSTLRRLVLGLYVSNDDGRSAVTWLKAQRVPQDPAEAEWIRKDEAWLHSAIAQAAVESPRQLSSREYSEAVESGLFAWNTMPGSEEGLAGLRAAQALSISAYAVRRVDKSLETALKQLMGSEHQAEGKRLLIAYYEFCGDKRGLQSLK